LVLLFLSSFVFPSPVLATDETCDCWCGKEGLGARSVSTQLASACDAACEAQGSGFQKIICTDNIRAKPPTDLTCWTADECSQQNGIWGSSDEMKTPIPKHCYGGDPAENYCYPDPEPMPLEILIGAPGQEVAQVDDLAEYVAAWYQWLLYAGVIIAVVMIMIGGVQYMVGKGMGSIDSAKKRIQSAIIGLVILFGAYIILSTVNPQLVLLQIPKYPMIKQVVYVDDSVKCEKLIELGYTMEYENRVYTKNSLGGDIDCGEQAEVSLDPNGDATDLENCFWSYCEDGASCLMPQSTDPNAEDIPECLACANISEDNDYGIVASNAICDDMSLTRVNNTHYTCFYTGDSEVVGVIDQYLDAGSCAMSTIDCDRVNDCGDYSGSPVTYGKSGNTTLHELPYPFGNYSLYNACNDNPCKYNGEEELQDGCTLVSDIDFTPLRAALLMNPVMILEYDFECEANEGQDTIVTGW